MKSYPSDAKTLSNQLAQRWQQLPIGKFLRFGIVGFSGVFVDLIIFYLLRTGLGWGFWPSQVIAIEAAIVNNFLWNDAWTFADVSKQQKGLSDRLKRLYKFNSVCLLGAVLQSVLIKGMLLLPFVTRLPGVAQQFTQASWTENAHEYAAKIVAIALVTLWNFWLNLKLSWKEKA